ncbi:hypothetical protein EXIGLDRAFT_709364 [Exidia glandulosa HHB12029]|uniref:RBR-type E3 ubiquitin transferase n=1 Tax=Exidia glandulosa HHB12029 TaxID=1314781 RepID=A0A165QJF9_EXIGL|nr:hypothetical protein EXIGLDRAFT_709364 [Exidia glandulosa HHB12029]
MQEQLNAEDRRLQSERNQLARYIQQTFDCAICMETLPEDSVARVDGCSHELCRSCMRQYIASALQERRYPILCPMCKTNREGREPSALSPHLVDNIGLTMEQFSLWNDLQISGLSVEMECQKCKKKMKVDREDYNAAEHIACPMQGCHYVWCKKCNQEIPLGPVNHSCDGTKELDGLMQKTGWKYCPGCHTPTEKIAGCNHMTCESPGCNTHFCYKCGELIVKSASQAEVRLRVGGHYARCELFRYA